MNKTIISSLLSLCLFSCATTQAPDKTDVLTKGDVRSPVITVPFIFSHKYEGKWNSIINTLNTTQANTVILYWAGNGGYVYIGERVMDAMRRAESRGVRVIVRVTGFSASMHAMGVCAATYVERSGTLMFHLRGYPGFVDKSWGSKSEFSSMVQGCIALGILTSSDVAAVQAGNELYISPSGSKWVLPDKRDTE